MSKPLVKNWSYSAWSTFNICLFRYYRKYICGDTEGTNEHLERGNTYHKKAEFYLTGKIQGVPQELKRLKADYQELKKYDPVVEKFWGVTRDWFKNDRGSWCVMKMDAAIEPQKLDGTLYIQDLKTGREYPEHKKQANLYAALGGAIFRDKFERVKIEMWYADTGKVSKFKYSEAKVLSLQEYWKEEGRRMEKQKKFLPTPSIDACKFCFLRTDKGGMCEGWKKI